MSGLANLRLLDGLAVASGERRGGLGGWIRGVAVSAIGTGSPGPGEERRSRLSFGEEKKSRSGHCKVASQRFCVGSESTLLLEAGLSMIAANFPRGSAEG
jgi:hypothetical protein